MTPEQLDDLVRRLRAKCAASGLHEHDGCTCTDTELLSRCLQEVGVESAVKARAAEAEAARLREELERLRNKSDGRCDHAQYKGMAVHGRCCPDCGTFLVDPGD